MDEFRKMAEEIYKKIQRVSVHSPRTDLIADALRTTAEKHEKIGWNKAVDECAKYVSGYKMKFGANINDIGKDVFEPAIRKLIKE